MLTLFYAGALTLIALFLAFKTVQRRLGSEILLGTGDNFELLQAHRAHANLIEYAVFFLILTGLMEASGQFSNMTIGILGDIFVLSRIAHAYGILQPESKSMFRTVGAVSSMFILAIQAFLALWVSVTWLAANNWGF